MKLLGYKFFKKKNRSWYIVVQNQLFLWELHAYHYFVSSNTTHNLENTSCKLFVDDDSFYIDCEAML